MNAVRLIVRATLLEAVRRKDAWVLVILMSVFAVVAVGTRVSDRLTPAVGTFMLNLGFSLSVIFAHVLTVLLASRQFPDEIENRTLYPLLARPLSRSRLLLGKCLSCTLAGCFCLCAFLLLTWIVTPATESMSPLMAVQAFLLMPFSLLWASALSLAVSLLMPRASALSLSLGVVLLGERLFQLVQKVPAAPHLLPRFGLLNLVTRLTDGISPLPFPQFAGLMLYGGLWAVLSFALARRMLLGRSL